MIRLLLDEGISRNVMHTLDAEGFFVEHALDSGLKGSPDPIIFLEAQKRQAALCTLNRSDFELLASAWNSWGLSAHYGLIVPRPGKQPSPSELATGLRRILLVVPALASQVVYL